MNGFKWRDRFACAVCNFLLNHVASEWYRNMVGGSIRLGLKTATRGGVSPSGKERGHA